MKIGIDFTDILSDEIKRVEFLKSLGSKQCQCGQWTSRWGLERWNRIKNEVWKEFPEACCMRYVEKQFADNPDLAKQILAKRQANA